MGIVAVICVMLPLLGLWEMRARAAIFIPRRNHVFNVVKTDPLPVIYVIKNSYLQCDGNNLQVSVTPDVQGLNAILNWQTSHIALDVDSSFDWPERIEFVLDIVCSNKSVQEMDYYQPLLNSSVVINFLPLKPLSTKHLPQCSQYGNLKYDIIENSLEAVLDDLFPSEESIEGEDGRLVLDMDKDASDYFRIQSQTKLEMIKPLDRESSSLKKDVMTFSVTCTQTDVNQEISKHTIHVQVKVYDADDNLPYAPGEDDIQIQFSEVQLRTSQTISLIDMDSRELTNAETYRITAKDTENVLTIVKTKYIKARKSTVISTQLQLFSTRNFALPHEIQVIFEDLTYSGTGTMKSRTKKIMKRLLIVNTGMANLLNEESMEKKFTVDPAAAKYSLIGSLSTDYFPIPSAVRWGIAHVVPHEQAGIIDITRSGEIYVKNASKLRSRESDSLSAKAVRFEGGNKTAEIQLLVMISSETRHENNEQILCDHGCSEFKDETSCTSSCGYGSQTGRCQWYKGHLVIGLSQSTCGPNPVHCPDGSCSQLEKLDPSICPQDCNLDLAHLPPGAHITNAPPWPTGYPHEQEVQDEAQGGCECPGRLKADCPCVVALSDGKSSANSSQRFTTPVAINYPNAHTVVEKDDQDKGANDAACSDTCRAGIAAGLAIGVIAVIVTIVGRVAWRRRQQAEPPTLKHVGSSVSMAAIPSDYIMDDSREQRTHVIRPTSSPSSGQWISKMGLNQEIDDTWEFPRNDLTLDDVIGEGEFGQVVRAEAKGMNGSNETTVVAIKMLKPDASGAEYQDLISEFNMLKEVDHPNVIRLLGVCTQKGPLYVIVEYCELGSLRSFLRSSKFKNKGGWDEKQRSLEDSVTSSQGCRILSARDFFSFAWQIAKGMEYLAGLKIVHRDLAARNVLVTENLMAKISDFGLSRDVYETNAYLKMSKGRIPVKWMAPESLYAQVCTTKSDIWSYGILLWEIATLGASPYPGIPPERLFPLLSTGYRMDRPEECPDEFYAIMQKCWKFAPEDRPSFCTLRNILDHFLQQKTEYLELSSEVHLSREDTFQVQNDNLRDCSDTWKTLRDDTKQGDNNTRYSNICPTSQVMKQPYVVTHWHGEEDSDNECPESSHLLSPEKQDTHLSETPQIGSEHEQVKFKKSTQNKPQRVMMHENLTYS